MTSNPLRNRVIDEVISFRLCNPNKLLVTFPQIHEVSDGHQQNFILFSIKVSGAIVDQSGKEFFITYPTTSFFEGSLSTVLFVPFSILAIIAFL